jgi:hypothetical protein
MLKSAFKYKFIRQKEYRKSWVTDTNTQCILELKNLTKIYYILESLLFKNQDKGGWHIIFISTFLFFLCTLPPIYLFYGLLQSCKLYFYRKTNILNLKNKTSHYNVRLEVHATCAKSNQDLSSKLNLKVIYLFGIHDTSNVQLSSIQQCHQFSFRGSPQQGKGL